MRVYCRVFISVNTSFTWQTRLVKQYANQSKYAKRYFHSVYLEIKTKVSSLTNKSIKKETIAS